MRRRKPLGSRCGSRRLEVRARKRFSTAFSAGVARPSPSCSPLLPVRDAQQAAVCSRPLGRQKVGDGKRQAAGDARAETASALPVHGRHQAKPSLWTLAQRCPTLRAPKGAQPTLTLREGEGRDEPCPARTQGRALHTWTHRVLITRCYSLLAPPAASWGCSR